MCEIRNMEYTSLIIVATMFKCSKIIYYLYKDAKSKFLIQDPNQNCQVLICHDNDTHNAATHMRV